VICHQSKCIFIHVPRCAGTSIETWITGTDWWTRDPRTKHLTAQQARTIYAEYWDEYFKFAVLRDPVARMISALKYASHFGLELRADGEIDFEQYFSRFGHPIVVEHDHRFHSRQEVLHEDHRPNAVYGNVLDAELDFVAKVESIERDMARVKRQLGFARSFDVHVEASPKQVSISSKTMEVIADLFAQDYQDFGL